MRDAKVVTLVIVAVLGWATGGVLGSEDLSDDAVAVLLDLKTINEVLGFCIKEEESLEPPETWMPLRTFANRLPEPYRDRLPSKDPWGHTFAILIHEQEWVVVSPGPDGMNEVRNVLEASEDPGPEGKERIRESDDVILVVGRDIVKPPPSRSELQRKTMDLIRALAAEVERFYGENRHYPARGIELGTLAAIAPDLHSGRTGRLPLEDAWGYPLLYWSDTNGFMIVSTGADGVLERDHAAAARTVGAAQYPGEVTGENTDIVYTGGRFVQWPRTHTHH